MRSAYYTEEDVSKMGQGPEALSCQADDWDSYSACACVEGFDGEEHFKEEQLSAWQYLIDTGLCWHLQGWYGRVAQRLIDAGLCDQKERN